MKKALEIKGLLKNFPDFQLGELSLDLPAGTVLGYVGPNGSGKTTTMQCIIGLLKADGGAIKVFGRENAPDKTDWKRDIGYVSDHHVFYENWSAEKNLKFVSKFYPRWDNKKADELIKRLELPLNKRVKNFSTGSRVKLSIILALAHSPKLLILDEPTAGLDPIVRSELLDILFSLIEDGEHSILYSTHILSDIARIADELAFLRNGKIIQRSEKDDLIEKWRRITCVYSGDLPANSSAMRREKSGTRYEIISSDYAKTLEMLKEAGAERIESAKMTIEEITVEILKGEENVKNSDI